MDNLNHEGIMLNESFLKTDNGKRFHEEEKRSEKPSSRTGKENKFLKLPKSQLTLFSEGQYSVNNQAKAGNRMDFTSFTKLDAVFPPALENRKVEDLEHLLASVPDVSEGMEINTDQSASDVKTDNNFNRVCGLNDAKIALRNIFVYQMLYSHFFPRNIKWNRVLLFGPPGTGKSLLVKAVAEEIQATLYQITSGDLLSPWHGETEKQIRLLFEEARTAEDAVILFFDEIDGLCRRRSSSESDSTRRIKTELLVQFQKDDTESRQSNPAYLVGATNCPWDIDPAFLRRFHKKIYIPLPDKTARIEILKQGFGEIETELTDVEWEYAGNLTEGYSGSDLINVVMSSCCERLVHTMSCQYWKLNGENNLAGRQIPNTKYSEIEMKEV